MGFKVATSTDQILTILRGHSFSRFSMSLLKSHLPTSLSQEAEIDDAMVELYQGHEQGVLSN